jgi:hypothetical protein
MITTPGTCRGYFFRDGYNSFMSTFASQFIIALTVSAALLCGCKESKSGGSGASNAGQSADAPTADGKSAPGAPPSAGHPWSQNDVEAWLREDLGLVQVSLKASGGDNYEGSGKDGDGTPYTLKVTQMPGRIVCEHRSPARTAPGKFTTGKIEFGSQKNP